IAERTTRDLYEAVQELQRSQSDLDEASARVMLLQQAAVAANEAGELADAARIVLEAVCHYTRWPVGHVYVADGPEALSPSSLWHVEPPDHYQRFRAVTALTRLRRGEG